MLGKRSTIDQRVENHQQTIIRGLDNVTKKQRKLQEDNIKQQTSQVIAEVKADQILTSTQRIERQLNAAMDHNATLIERLEREHADGTRRTNERGHTLRQ